MEDNVKAPSAPQGKLTGLKKRQQVIVANKKVFMWVAIAALIITVCIVVSQFFFRQFMHNLDVIAAKSATNKTIVQNKENVKTVVAKVDAMLANENLSKARANQGDRNFQVILDALPATGDAATFANSLANVILPPANASISSLSAGVQGASVATVPAAQGSESTPQMLPFVVGLSGNADQFQEALRRIERTIRPINVTKIMITGDTSTSSMTLDGNTYFLPSVQINLGTKEIPYEKK